MLLLRFAQIQNVMLLQGISCGICIQRLLIIHIDAQRVCDTLVNLIDTVGGDSFSLWLVEKSLPKAK